MLMQVKVVYRCPRCGRRWTKDGTTVRAHDTYMTCERYDGCEEPGPVYVAGPADPNPVIARPR